MSPPEKRLKLLGVAVCYLPFVLSMALGTESREAWWISWVGSWFIFAMVWSGRVFTLEDDRLRSDQALRPWFIMHLVYAGYSFTTSVFYWLDLQGWYFLNPGHHAPAPEEQLALASRAQVLYGLAHAALVTGFGLARGPAADLPWRWASRRSLPEILIKGSAVAYLGALGFGSFPGLDQFAVKARSLAIVAAGMSLGLAFREKEARWVPLAVGINGVMFMVSLMSGWKEASLVLVLLNALAFYPFAPVRVSVITAMVFVAAFVILPSVSNTIRRETWYSANSKKEALNLAWLELSEKSSQELVEETWGFLTHRLSEQALFASYLDATPGRVEYHGWGIAGQALAGLVPRQLWPDKPILEQLVMKRVYENGAVSEHSSVSAKPQFIVDGYLSAGAVGVLLSGLVLGWLSRTCSRWCEEHFGGYLIGGVVFNGLFAIFWRANCWEFLLNPVLWSLFLAWVLHHLARMGGWITPQGTAARTPEAAVPGPSTRAVGRAFRQPFL
jgi:hypothetical protein